MKDYYKFYKTNCKIRKKNLTDEIKNFCNYDKPVNESWVNPFCEGLKKKIDHLTLEFKNMNREELLDLVSKLNKNVRRNSSKEYLISVLLDSLKNCHNQLSIYGDEISEIPPEKLYITSSGYCHNIDELMTFIIGTEGKKNIEPHDSTNTIKIWQNEGEKNKIINFKHVDVLLKNKYNQIMNKKNILPIPLDKLQNMMNMIAYLAFVCLNDDPSSFEDGDFSSATEALGLFSEIINQFEENERTFIYQLKNGSGTTLLKILQDDAMCIHMKGDQILNIYLYSYRKWGVNGSMLKLVGFVIYINDNLYGTVRLYEEKLVNFNKYAQIRYILSFYNEDKDQFVQIDRNYLGFYKKYPILKVSLSDTIVQSILDALKFFKIIP